MRSSEAAASYRDWTPEMTVRQPYRAAVSIPQESAPAESMLTEVRELKGRVAAMRQCAAGAPSSASLEQVANELSFIEAKTLRPNQRLEGPTYYDSCSHFADEASRVRSAGRLPFACDR